MTAETAIAHVQTIIKNNLDGPYQVYLFGSWAKGTASSNSDIDIGILGRKKIAWNEMSRILDSADQIGTLRSIDIVDLCSVDQNFREKVLQYAKLIEL